MQGSSLEEYIRMTKRSSEGAGGGLPSIDDASAGVKSVLSGASDALGSVQDAAGSAVSSLTEGQPIQNYVMHVSAVELRPSLVS